MGTLASSAIICLGNPLLSGDDLGSRVYACLKTTETTGDIDVIDGGLCGLNLLGLLEGRRRVVFVDALAGVGKRGEIVVLDAGQAAAYAGTYGHGAGLPYLLHMLPHVCAAPLPDLALIGAVGVIDDAGVRALAARSMEIVRHGLA